MTKVLLCGCASAFQDSRYGKGMRVHNRTKQNKKEIERMWRCTVCGHERG